MPNEEQIRKAAERRLERKQATQASVDKAAAQDLAQIGAATPEAKLDAAAEVRQRSQPMTKAERKRVTAKAVDEAVLRQDLTPVPDALAGYTHVPGVVPPLHIQNALARQAAEGAKDEARELAQKVGKSTYDAALDIGGRGQHSKFKRMRRADDLMRTSQQAQK